MTSPHTYSVAARLAAQSTTLIGAYYRQGARTPCTNCGTVLAGYAYGHQWCETCLHGQGYLPDSWNTEETWISFKPMFLFLSGLGLWDSLRELASRWDREAESLMLTLTVDQLLTGQLPQQTGCKACAKVLPVKGAINGCCDRKCYGVWYRGAKADEIEAARLERAAERERKAQALKAR